MNLESLQSALNYFSDKTDKVVVQPKFMGSYCNIYLFEDIENCYAISRNGYKINRDLTSIYQELLDKFHDDFTNGLVCRIFAGELLPWSILGRDLIDRHFYSHAHLLQNEFDFCQQYNYQQALDSLVLSEKEKKYAYLLMMDDQPNISRFMDQVNLYGKDGDPYYEPFDILKDIYADKEELRILESNNEKWCQINNHPHIFSSPSSYNEINDFYESLVFDKGYEGIVIKPEFYSTEFAPAIKVRNPEYLRIVYGHDYTDKDKYVKLFNRKRINRKLRQSIIDFNNGLNMLSVPYNEINKENKFYVDSLVRSIGFKEETDPRL